MSLSDMDMALAVVAHSQFTELAIADAAASDKGSAKLLRFAVRDQHNHDIVIGDMLVFVACGSAECMRATAKEIVQAASAIVTVYKKSDE